MNLYAVVFDPDEEKTQEAIDYAKSQFEEECFSLCSNVLLIKSEKSVGALSRKLNLSKKSDYTAVVFHLDSEIAGYYGTNAWKWLEAAFREIE